VRLIRLLLVALGATFLRRLRSGPRRAGWTWTFEFIVELMRRDWMEMRSWKPAQIRAEFERKPLPKSATRKVRYGEIRLDGIRALSFEPPSKRSPVVILYFHGGSYLFGSPETHLDVAARFALAAGARVVLPEYRLAPEHRYPAALDDALRVFRALIASGTDPAHIAVTGESAGGNLALALPLALVGERAPLPRAVALLSPWLDLSASFPSTRTQLDDYGDRELVVEQARLVAGELSLDDPRLSLIHRDPKGLPRLLIQVGGAERLHDEAVELDRRAREAGVDARLDVLPEMPHAAQLLAEWSREGQSALERAASFLTAA
jgi:acetyl esterase/lipase